jgi:exodeoxyribonuclease-3
MRIATWNINGIKARLPRVLEWLEEFKPDIALLQEIKSMNETFPAMEIESLGYNLVIHGQKSYNGVAILSKYPIEDTLYGLPGDDSDEQARYIEAFTGGIRVATIYLPNGNPQPGEKFDYKLAWMDRLITRTKTLLEWEEAFILGGDYNVIPADIDCHDPAAWVDDALTQPESRARLRTLINLGLTDALRVYHKETIYSYWDYQRGAWQKDNGIRIDHLLCSPQATDRLKDAGVDRTPRGKEKPSDHTPVWCELAD